LKATVDYAINYLNICQWEQRFQKTTPTMPIKARAISI
jgi:hypothetical protein